MQRIYLLAIAFSLSAHATAFGQLNFGMDCFYGSSDNLTRDLPVTTIKGLSIPGDDNSPTMVLRIYRLIPADKKIAHPTADELVPLVRELFDAPSWHVEGAYLKAINNRLIVRQRADVHAKIFALLIELQVLDAPRASP